MISLYCWRKSVYFCFAIISALTFGGCMYSFTGAAVPEHWKSIAIPLFEDESTFGQPSLRENLTNTLISKVQKDNTLRFGDRANASVELRGRITNVLADKPLAVSTSEQASRYQVIISVSAELYDNVKKKQVWSKTFQATGEYDASAGTSGRDEGVSKAIEKLSDDLLLETISTW
jgi:hypothetical protein